MAQTDHGNMFGTYTHKTMLARNATGLRSLFRLSSLEASTASPAWAAN